jgi:type VI protein secretion system component VasF
MPLEPAVRKKLEELGVEWVCNRLRPMSDGDSGIGRATPVDLGDGISAFRGDLEDWVREKNAAAKAEEKRRQRRTFVVSVMGIVVAVAIAAWSVVQGWAAAAIVAAWPVVQGWLR